jgi:hypothetical protein
VWPVLIDTHTPLVGAYTDKEHMSLALTDSLVCLEMPFFAIAHVRREIRSAVMRHGTLI